MRTLAVIGTGVVAVPDEWIADEWLAVVATATGTAGLIARSLVDYRQHPTQQIGGAASGLRNQLRHARRHMGPDYLERQVRRAHAAVYRLDALDDGGPDVVSGWRDRAGFFRRRAELPRRPIKRIATIGREWRLGHYHRFGYGWKSAVHDLVTP